MNPARLALSIPAMLALAACAPGEDDDGKRAPGPPIGFELAMAATPATESAAPEVLDLTPQQLEARLAAGTIRLIDVRTDKEVAEGMISGAEHIPLDAFDPAALDTDDDREIVFYCRSGRRSGIAGEELSAHLGKPVSHLAGGIIAWQEAKKPVITP